MWTENSTSMLLFSFINRKAETIEPNPIGLQLVVHKQHSRECVLGAFNLAQLFQPSFLYQRTFARSNFCLLSEIKIFNSCTKSSKTYKCKTFVVKWITQENWNLLGHTQSHMFTLFLRLIAQAKWVFGVLLTYLKSTAYCFKLLG